MEICPKPWFFSFSLLTSRYLIYYAVMTKPLFKPLISSIVKWWQNLPVSKKLYGVVGVMATLIAIELLTLYFAMTTLSAVRAFVGGEGLWSKAQKTAVYHLQKYANTHDEKYFQLYLEQLKIPLGDRQARIELEKKEMNRDRVVEGFLNGENHPHDIPPMINLVRRFYWEPHLARAFDRWREGDRLITEFMVLGNSLQQTVRSESMNIEKIENIMMQIFELDDHLTTAENEFSFALGEASRWIENLLMIVLLLAVISIEGTGLYLTVAFARGLTRSLNELNDAATRIGEGDFSKRAPVLSTDELGQLAISLNKMTDNIQVQVNERQNAEHASETKNLFLANMSHEIRTPLNAILGFSEILADSDLSSKERTHYAAIIKRTGASLTSIINDILDVTKVEAEQLNVVMKTFSLNQLISDIFAILRLRCEEKGVELTFSKKGEFTDIIQSDPARLRQILVNIIGNSIKFTEKGFVRVDYEVKNNHLIFSVKDTGTGISHAQVGRLFKPFSQGDNSVRKKFGGTGLGLLIAQKLAQLLGGDVRLEESHIGQGSRFSISIAYVPMQSAQPESVKTSSENVPTAANTLLKGKKVLVVEDSPDNQLLAELYLSRSGATVEFANNGLEGVRKIKTNNYDVVLMDIQMPVMDGYTATQEARNFGIKIPIVALTGFAMKEDQQKCLEAGCDDYLAKPFDRQSLIKCITKAIAQAAPHTEPTHLLT